MAFVMLITIFYIPFWYPGTGVVLDVLFTDRSKAVLFLLIVFVSYASCLLCVMLWCLLLEALWSPARKGLTSWLSCLLCFVTCPKVSWSTSELRRMLAP